MGLRDNLTRRTILKGAATGAGALSLAACGGGSGESNKTVIKHWDWYVTQGPTIDEEVRLFMEANPDIEIKRQVQVNDKYPELLAAARNGGNMPDIYQIPGSPTLSDQVKNNWLAPISEFSDFDAFVNTFPKPEQNFSDGSNVFDGKTYSAPFEGAGPGITLWINTKIFKDAGLVDNSGKIKAPKTFEEMLTASRTIKQKLGSNGIYGYGFGGKLNYHDYWVLSVLGLSANGSDGGGFNMKTGKFDYADNPAYKEALEWFVKMRDEQHIIPDSASVDDEGIRFLFSQHKFGMLLAGVWVINGWQQTSPTFSEYTMVHPPLYKGQINGSYSTGLGGVTWGLSKDSKVADAAWKWYKWLYGKEAGERWVKAGNGLSIHTSANKPEFVQNAALKSHIEQANSLVHIWPSATIRNPNINQLKEPPTKGNDVMVKAIYTGQTTDIAGELKKMQDEKQKAREQGIQDAVNAGLDIKLEDWHFPDWDPTKDYITEPRIQA